MCRKCLKKRDIYSFLRTEAHPHTHPPRGALLTDAHPKGPPALLSPRRGVLMVSFCLPPLVWIREGVERRIGLAGVAPVAQYFR